MAESVTAQWIVLDIEGTMTPTERVHVVLYDYARRRLGPWLDEHAAEAEVGRALQAVRSEAGLAETASTAEITEVLHQWMDADRKVSALKALQGWIWHEGFERGELEMEFFADVVPALHAWREAGLRLAVFSSGSVTAQRSSFSNTSHGDIRGLFDAHFDTVNAGPKKEVHSYRAIAAALEAAEEDLVFVSDVPAELDAARDAGWHGAGLARAGEPFAAADFHGHPVHDSFSTLTVEPAP